MAKDLGPYRDIVKRKSALYALLVSSGYLKVCSPIQKGGCAVAIPNYEIAQVFTNDIQEKINCHLSVGTGDIAGAIVRRDFPALKDAIASFLLESVSYFDTAAEGFFHGLTLGFLAVLRDEFRVLSNVESGEGRFDIALKPRIEGFPAFIIEVKKADGPDEDLKALARAAREQIDGKKYDTTFRTEGISDIEKLGLAYCKNRVELCRWGKARIRPVDAGLIPRLVFAPHFAEGAHEVVVRGHARAGDSIVLGRFTYTSPNPAPSGCLRKA